MLFSSTIHNIMRMMLVMIVLLAPCFVRAGDKSASAPRYLRIDVAPELTVHIQVKGDELRMAGTGQSFDDVEAIKAANVRKRNNRSDIAFPGVWLSRTPIELNGRKITPKLKLKLYQFTSSMSILGYTSSSVRWASYGELFFDLKDDSETVWTYVSGFSCNPQDTREKAPVVAFPKPELPRMKISASSMGNKRFGVGLRAYVGKAELDTVWKGRNKVQVDVEIRDSNDQVVFTKKGVLPDFGFG